ncbi:MAG TPA: coproporphyrinogen dehydrogenase HemZ [Clostridia bacterium]|nr:coproporphyrinogen dehydrogenase HemZ [Clostridia bacterium]
MTIYILTSIQEYSNELAELARAFYPGRVVKTDTGNPEDLLPGDLLFRCEFQTVGDTTKIAVKLFKGMETSSVFSKTHRLRPDTTPMTKRRDIKNCMKQMLYDILMDLTDRSLDWGALTGVRPTKIAHGLIDEGLDRNKVLKLLYDDYRVSQKKAELLHGIAKIQRPFFCGNHPNRISVYINIPICPTKCLYCSFPSATMDQCAHLVDDYITALEYEMETMSILAREKGIEVETVYIGGGTPTSLNTVQLERVLRAVREFWGWSPWKEYTVEGGRPDTMSGDKLRVLKDHSVTRISINPQSMNDKTLGAIGRNHKAHEIVECFYRARDVGFDCINMDVIVGLPGEGIEEGRRTMGSIKKLAPDNLTVHTLAVKRASRLKDNLERFALTDERLAAGMMDIFYEGAGSMGMKPYYLYRQKYMLGNMENVGFATPGKESIYNMQIMEDRQTIWAFGAAAITKVIYPTMGRIERAANVKNIGDYIDRTEEMVQRKLKICTYS